MKIVNARTLSLTDTAKILAIRREVIRDWIKSERLPAIKMPHTYCITAADLAAFVIRRRYPSVEGLLTSCNADKIIGGELVTIPKAAIKIGIKKGELYAANAKHELVFFDLSDGASRGLRVITSDVERWAEQTKTQRDLEIKTYGDPENAEALGDGDEVESDTVPIAVPDHSSDSLLSFARRELIGARDLFEAAERFAKAETEYHDSKKTLDRIIASRTTRLEDGDVLIESGDDLRSYLSEF